MNIFTIKAIATVLMTVAMLSVNTENSMVNAETENALANSTARTVKGLSGGVVDSQGCGYIANTPSYEMNLAAKVDYMRFTVEAAAGQPTLLVVGPNPGDSFCVLGDEISGLKPEISGVWEAGDYRIYVGNRTKEQHEFILDISTDN
ncbi:MAG: hypothetical protein AAFQ41_16775 [Cyanobacteria bacterium J06623_7]